MYRPKTTTTHTQKMSVHVLVCISVILREVYIFNFICF